MLSRILRTVTHYPLPRLPFTHTYSSLANRDILTDDDFPFAGWAPPPTKLANEWSLEWSETVRDVNDLEKECVTGGGGKLREGGQRPAVAARKEKKRLEKLEAKLHVSTNDKNPLRDDTYKKRGINPLYKKPWNPAFKKAFPGIHDASAPTPYSKKEYKPWQYKRKPWDPNFKKATPDTHDDADAPRNEYRPQLNKRGPRTTPEGAPSTQDPAAQTYKKTHRGRRQSAAFNLANPRSSGAPVPRGPRTTRTTADSGPIRKRKKWALPPTGPVTVEPTRLQKYLASQPRNKIERWKVEKAQLQTKLNGAKWNPKKKLSPEALDGIRALHAGDPEYTTEKLSQLFEVSPEAIRKVLKSKWRPDPATHEDRMARWERRGDRVFWRWVEMGVVSTKKMRKAKMSRRKAREVKWGVEKKSVGEEKRYNIVKEVEGLKKRIV